MNDSNLRVELLAWADVLNRRTGTVPAVDVAWKLRQLAGATPTTGPAPAAADGADQPHEAEVDNAVAGALLDVYGFLPLTVRYGAAEAARQFVEYCTSGPATAPACNATEGGMGVDCHLSAER